MSIYSIGLGALQAAQVGITTTGHNIANASTPGYTRQEVDQATNPAQQFGFGFVGQGTHVDTVKRIFDNFLTTQVSQATSAKFSLDAYSTQISQIDNMVADSTAGLSPALQNFFKSVQNLAASPSTVAGTAARQSMISSGQALASRLQGMQGTLDNLMTDTNGQITSTVTQINSLATAIAQTNTQISAAEAGASQPANDLRDQRDELVRQLSQLTQVSVVPQGSSYDVFIGTGQALVLDSNTNALKTVPSLTDPQRVEVAYSANGQSLILSDTSLPGGTLGGLLQFRSQSLDVAQNSLGRVAIGLASTFNDQHKLGQDLNGNLGGNFFNVAPPRVTASSLNTGNAVIGAAFAPNTGPNTGVGALTTSDYNLSFDGANYTITRLSDGTKTTAAALPQTVDGVVFSLTSGAMNAGDQVLVRPTADGASNFNVLITDTSKIAAAVPVSTNVPSTNTGTGTISPGSINSTFVAGSLSPPQQFTYSAAGNTVTNPAAAVIYTAPGAAPVTYAANAPIPFTPGATYSFGGVSNTAVSFTLGGTPANGDVFNIGPNTNGSGDGRNAVLLGQLQASNTLVGSTTTYQGAYAQFVSLVGNQASQLKITSAAQNQMLTQATKAQQSVQGVNLDEEATKLLQYQQAYQAAGKMMQTATTLFNTLLSIDR